MGRLLRQNSPRSDLLECRTVLDIMNTPPVSIKYGIKVHIKDLLGFNRGHEWAWTAARRLCLPFASLNETRGIVTPYDESTVIFD